MRVERDGRYALVASPDTTPRRPDWYHNVLANPAVELQDGAVKRDYRAREVHGAERDAWCSSRAGISKVSRHFGNVAQPQNEPPGSGPFRACRRTIAPWPRGQSGAASSETPACPSVAVV
jgi:deazaflavin-dependent oxidoreductase (nitroreductase family)